MFTDYEVNVTTVAYKDDPCGAFGTVVGIHDYGYGLELDVEWWSSDEIEAIPARELIAV